METGGGVEHERRGTFNHLLFFCNYFCVVFVCQELNKQLGDFFSLMMEEISKTKKLLDVALFRTKQIENSSRTMRENYESALHPGIRVCEGVCVWESTISDESAFLQCANNLLTTISIQNVFSGRASCSSG
jgi:hypothetical protein